MEYNDSSYDNSSFSFFGPLEMAMINDEYTALESTEIKMVFSVILVIIMIMSLIGNISTGIVIMRDNSMRTPTNAYLLSLAATDLLLSLCVPIELYTVWVPYYYPLGEIGCYIHWLLMNGLSNTNVLTISAFTIERYLVISRPFLKHSFSKMSRVYKIIGLIWLLSWAICLPELLWVEFLENKKFVYCYTTMSNTLRIYFVTVQIFLFFVIPMAMILILYTLIAIELKSVNLRRSPITGNQHRDKAVRMLAAVAGSFFYCRSPLNVMEVMIMIPKYRQKYYYDTWRVVYYVATLNEYLTTMVNPILYSLMSRKFRQAFKEIFSGRSKVTLTKHEVKTVNTDHLNYWTTTGSGDCSVGHRMYERDRLRVLTVTK